MFTALTRLNFKFTTVVVTDPSWQFGLQVWSGSESASKSWFLVPKSSSNDVNLPPALPINSSTHRNDALHSQRFGLCSIQTGKSLRSCSIYQNYNMIEPNVEPEWATTNIGRIGSHEIKWPLLEVVRGCMLNLISKRALTKIAGNWAQWNFMHSGLPKRDKKIEWPLEIPSGYR